MRTDDDVNASCAHPFTSLPFPSSRHDHRGRRCDLFVDPDVTFSICFTQGSHLSCATAPCLPACCCVRRFGLLGGHAAGAAVSTQAALDAIHFLAPKPLMHVRRTHSPPEHGRGETRAAKHQ